VIALVHQADLNNHTSFFCVLVQFHSRNCEAGGGPIILSCWWSGQEDSRAPKKSQNQGQRQRHSDKVLEALSTHTPVLHLPVFVCIISVRARGVTFFSSTWCGAAGCCSSTAGRRKGRCCVALLRSHVRRARTEGDSKDTAGNDKWGF